MSFLIYLIIFFGIFGYFLDLKLNKDFLNCKKTKKFHLILLFHHLLSSYFILGIFFGKLSEMKVYLIALFILYSSWFVYNHNCLITYYNNKEANIDCEVPFRSPFTYYSKTSNKDLSEKAWIQYVQVPLFIAITFLKIGYVTRNKI